MSEVLTLSRKGLQILQNVFTDPLRLYLIFSNEKRQYVFDPVGVRGAASFHFNKMERRANSEAKARALRFATGSCSPSGVTQCHKQVRVNLVV